MGGLSITHWMIVVLVVILLFGARRLPDTARGLARSLRIFKSEMGDGEQAEPQQRVSATPNGNLGAWPKIENPAQAPSAAFHDDVEQKQTTPADELKKTG